VLAAVNTTYGPPEVVRVREVDPPATGDRDVLVRVHATTVNRTDCAYRAARPFFMRTATGLVRPRRHILGTEYAGVVEAAGRSVTSLVRSERVFGYNEGAFGAHAEFVAVFPFRGRISGWFATWQPDPDRSVPAGDRPAVSARPDRRRLPIRRDRSKDRQRGDRRGPRLSGHGRPMTTDAGGSTTQEMNPR